VEGYTRSDIIKVATLSTIGTTIEWYDFFISATAASTVWPYIYFNSQNVGVALLYSLLIFSTGFLDRPIGAIIFGNIGDKRGRKETLVYTLLLMGLGTLGIGLTPPYLSTGSWPGIGIFAPILLIIFRLLQGLAVGGEWGGASTIVTEYAAKSKYRAFWASWVQQGVPLGIIAASVAFIALQVSFPGKAFFDWGWRIAYYIGAAILLIGALIRYRVLESPVFKKIIQKRAILNIPFARLIKNEWRTVLLLALGWAYNNALFYVIISFVQYYIIALGFPQSFPQELILIASIMGMFLIILGAILADRVGRKPVIIISTLVSSILIFVFFMLLNTKDIGLMFLGSILISTGYLGYAVYSAFFSEQFPTRYRYSGSSFSYHLSTPISGGLAPVIASYIYALFNNNYLLAWPYIALMVFIYGVISAIVISLTKETVRIELEEE